MVLAVRVTQDTSAQQRFAGSTSSLDGFLQLVRTKILVVVDKPQVAEEYVETSDGNTHSSKEPQFRKCGDSNRSYSGRYPVLESVANDLLRRPESHHRMDSVGIDPVIVSGVGEETQLRVVDRDSSVQPQC